MLINDLKICKFLIHCADIVAWSSCCVVVLFLFVVVVVVVFVVSTAVCVGVTKLSGSLQVAIRTAYTK